jgi:hypothetical protein
MKRVARLAVSMLALATLGRPAAAHAWGYVGHRMIEEQAIDTLPEPLRTHFHAHRREISDWSIEPDTLLKERHGRDETVKHFLDLDLYGVPPFPALPRSKRAAIARYGEKTVNERGTVPWTIEEKHARLVREMRAGDWAEALKTAAYAGHYCADATMPLHAVSNYDGKATGNDGIHKAVERDAVDARIEDYFRRLRPLLHPARPERYGSAEIFAVLSESYAAVPALLAADTEARASDAPGSAAYVDRLEQRAGAMLAARLARAIELVAAFWLSAWQEAGRPTPR